MKKTHLLAILFFSGAWGLSEAVLGDALYARHVPFASAGLTMVAFLLLAVARPFLPRWGGATAVGLLAMLYKFLNVPFFACHLTGIALLGVSWDLVFGVVSRGPLFRGFTAPVVGGAGGVGRVGGVGGLGSWVWLRNSALGAAAAYLGYVMFVLAMVFVFRSEHWIQKGLTGALQHVFVSGSLAAAGCAVAVPLGLRLGERLRGRAAAPGLFGLQPRLAGAIAGFAGLGLWVYGLAGKIVRG
jgi:hypothetical protein